MNPQYAAASLFDTRKQGVIKQSKSTTSAKGRYGAVAIMNAHPLLGSPLTWSLNFLHSISRDTGPGGHLLALNASCHCSLVDSLEDPLVAGK